MALCRAVCVERERQAVHPPERGREGAREGARERERANERERDRETETERMRERARRCANAALAALALLGFVAVPALAAWVLRPGPADAATAAT